jgi:hypothetical protein
MNSAIRDAKKELCCAITFTDGNIIGCAWDATDNDIIRKTSCLDCFIQTYTIALNTEERLSIIPLSSVRYAAINPIPQYFPGHVYKEEQVQSNNITEISGPCQGPETYLVGKVHRCIVSSCNIFSDVAQRWKNRMTGTMPRPWPLELCLQ